MKLSLFIPFKSITNTRAFLFWSEWLDDLSSCTTSSSPFTLTSWFVAGLHNIRHILRFELQISFFFVFGVPIDFGQHPRGDFAVRASSKIETKAISWNGVTGRTIFIFPYPRTVADLERVNGNAWRTEWHCLIDSLLVECMLGQPAFHYILAENYIRSESEARPFFRPSDMQRAWREAIFFPFVSGALTSAGSSESHVFLFSSRSFSYLRSL